MVLKDSSVTRIFLSRPGFISRVSPQTFGISAALRCVSTCPVWSDPHSHQMVPNPTYLSVPPWDRWLLDSRGEDPETFNHQDDIDDVNIGFRSKRKNIPFRVLTDHLGIYLLNDRARAGASLMLTCAMRVWFGIGKVEQNLLSIVEVVLADDEHGAVHGNI